MGAELSPGTGVAGIFLPDSRPNALQEASAVLQGAAFAAAPVAVVEVTGPGAVQCMQGLVTNDLETGGNTSFQYGALLTTKGMIVCDMWLARNDASLTLYPDLLGKEALLLVLERSLPPRFATVTDRSEKRAVLRLVGRNATEVATRTGFTLPSEGNADAKTTQTTARPNSIAPFSLQIDCADGDVDVAVSSLSTAGATAASPDVLELARILGGWPRLGAEIDDKTLPQEVRYDELGGVSYTKGCYLGQETVARLHHRGHTNKRVLGLKLDTMPDTADPVVKRGDRTVGRLTSAAWFGPEHGHLGLGMIRSEVDLGVTVSAGGVSAETVTLPFELGK
jgi:folate-binding protein YgfZ